MTHPLFGPELREMMRDGDSGLMRTFCETLHPATVAETLTEEDFSPEQVWKVLEQTGIAEQAAVFEYLPIDWQVKLAEGTGRPHMARLIEQMSHDDRVALLRELDPQVVDSLLRLVDEADRRDIAALVKYEEGTVGGIMTTDYAWLPATLTASEATERLRQQAPDRETIYYVYVLDEATRKLLGIVSLRDLILAPKSALLYEIMERDLIALKATDPQQEAANQLARYDLIALPVVDDEGRLIGIVTHDDALDVVEQEATEALQRQAAVGPLDESYIEARFFTIWRKRVFWLIVLFLGQMFTFEAMAYFDDAMKQMTVLALFVPLCLSCGGNSGSQASTLITRALALGEIGVKDWMWVLRHELLMGLALGCTLGVLGLVRTYVLTPRHLLGPEEVHHFRILILLTIVIAQAVTAICMWGTLVGAMLPLFFKKIGVDPAVASSPFVATFCDVTGIVIYFTIAKAFLAEFMTEG